MNAVAHGVEARYGPGACPVADALATEGVGDLAAGLPAAVERPAGLEGRTRALRGAWLAGAALAVAGTGLHHQLCHVSGAPSGSTTAASHAVLLPYTVAFATPAVPAAMAGVAGALGAGTAAGGLWDLGRRLGAPASLAELGLAAADLDHAAELAAAQVSGPPGPPRPGSCAGCSAPPTPAGRRRQSTTTSDASARVPTRTVAVTDQPVRPSLDELLRAGRSTAGGSCADPASNLTYWLAFAVGVGAVALAYLRLRPPPGPGPVANRDSETGARSLGVDCTGQAGGVQWWPRSAAPWRAVIYPDCSDPARRRLQRELGAS
jgi:hypothetical protein